MRQLLPLLPLVHAVGCFAPIEGPRAYPHWEASNQSQPLGGCADAFVAPRKTGKEGLGLGLRIVGRSGPCTVQVRALGLRVGDALHPAKALPPTLVLQAGDEAFFWVAVPFDGDAVWNDPERRAGTFVVETSEGSASFPLVLTMEDRTKCAAP